MQAYEEDGSKRRSLRNTQGTGTQECPKLAKGSNTTGAQLVYFKDTQENR